MLLVHTLCLGDLQTNCYVIQDRQSSCCCLVDPADNADQILAYLNKAGLRLNAILLTHGHFDHVGAVRDIAADTDCKVYIHQNDLALPTVLTGGPLYYTDTYKDGDHLHFPGLDIDVIGTPGHTPGSVCLIVEDSMFAGDTLFARSCGRTDLPGGDPAEMVKSLFRLAQLPVNYRVFPGHGRATTLAEEKKSNPYLL